MNGFYSLDRLLKSESSFKILLENHIVIVNGNPETLTAVLSVLVSAQRGPAASVFLSVSAGPAGRAGAGRQPVCC